jgi:hypothetical protein
MYKGIPGVATWVRRIVVALLAATVTSTSIAVPKEPFSLVSPDTRLGPSFPNEYVLNAVRSRRAEHAFRLVALGPLRSAGGYHTTYHWCRR